MIEMNLSIPLPTPWDGGTFETDQIGSVNFLVGPNGSGKSQFAKELAKHLQGARMLGTDRLSGMEQVRPFASLYWRSLLPGTAKESIQLTSNNQKTWSGSGISTLVLLEERMDLRIQLEAVLGNLFNREIILGMGLRQPDCQSSRRRDDNVAYRLDREECHGIKELCVLLTHLVRRSVSGPHNR